MTLNLDLSGNDLIVNSISTGATAGQAGVPMLSSPSRFALKAINFNSATTDNTLAITLPSGVSRYAIRDVWINNASHTLVTATIGVFTAASAGGQTIAADQAITVTSGTADTNNNAQSLTLTHGSTECYTDTTLYVRIGTAEGVAATADVVVNVIWLT